MPSSTTLRKKRPKCLKHKFSKEGVLQALISIANDPDPARRERRSYWCARCGAYHLTSWE